MKNVLLLLVFFLLNVSSLALKKPYVVYMGAHSHGPDATKDDFDRVTDFHHSFLATFVGSREEARDAIFDSYTRHINGFAAFLEEHQAAEIAKHPNVVSVFLNKGMKTHTTHSWDFMRLEYKGQPTLPWIVSRFGEDAIIGNLDTGVWPESKSFNDEGLGPVPSRWNGECEQSNITTGVHCNRKLIGARHFNKGYKAVGGNVSPSMESARDYEGHGSHTLSTAGGSFVGGASIFNGDPLGTAKGGSPRARVASYKVCWFPTALGFECVDSDVMAAFDMAIHDGVDVISISLGGSAVDFLEDGIAIGSFHAVQNGIVVVCSAGNSGPEPGYVTNIAPWIITVGASTMDREFESSVQLGDGLRFKGASLSGALPKHGLYPLISAADAKLAGANATEALLCKEKTLDKKKVQGKILACLRGDTARIDKGMQAKLAGAAGMILCNNKDDGNATEADFHFLPATHIDYEDGLTLFEYINSTKEPTAYLTPPAASFDVKPAPYMASFSSRGPNQITPEILKPDITAPGVDVIAAYSPAVPPTEFPFDHRNVSYITLSGTSMSCPHVSGVAGLLKTLYPTWSPAAIRSAIMTSAKTRDNTFKPLGNGPGEKATPFDYGAGHIRPTQAVNPGLIYDLTTTDYLDFLCGMGYNSSVIEKFHHGSHKCSNSSSSRTSLMNLNYPSITVTKISGSVTVTRTVTNVGYPGTYYARIRQPTGVSVTVEPNVLKFKKIGEKKKFEVTFKLERKAAKNPDYKFGELLWSDEKHHVRSPIVVLA